jgi:CheY-like chemotaxis protein
MLSSTGAAVATAGNVSDALRYLEERRPDVVVSDIGMPGEDGYELIRRVRATRDAHALPAIAITAYARAEDRAKVIDAGFQQHLAKPLDPARVVSSVASLVREARSG